MNDEALSPGGAMASLRAARCEAEALAVRLGQLQAVNAALSRARTPDEVAEATLSAALEAMGADSGVVLVQGAGAGLEVLRVAGVSEEALRRATAGVPDTPARAAFRSAAPLFLESPAAFPPRFCRARRYCNGIPGFAVLRVLALRIFSYSLSCRSV